MLNEAEAIGWSRSVLIWALKMEIYRALENALLPTTANLSFFANYLRY